MKIDLVELQAAIVDPEKDIAFGPLAKGGYTVFLVTTGSTAERKLIGRAGGKVAEVVKPTTVESETDD